MMAQDSQWDFCAIDFYSNMINKITRRIAKFCCEDIANIENYQQAVNDQKQIWCLHHRAEILPCGIFSTDDLKQFGLYYNRPAYELIFLPQKEHTRLHAFNKNRKQSTKQKLRNSVSKALKGKSRRPMQEATKMKLSKQNRGRKWWNNGKVNVMAFTCPEGFVAGLIKHV